MAKSFLVWLSSYPIGSALVTHFARWHAVNILQNARPSRAKPIGICFRRNSSLSATPFETATDPSCLLQVLWFYGSW